MAQFTQTIYDGHVENNAQRRYFKTVSSRTALLPRLGQVLTALARKLNI
jgi:hypothetical protein